MLWVDGSADSNLMVMMSPQEKFLFVAVLHGIFPDTSKGRQVRAKDYPFDIGTNSSKKLALFNRMVRSVSVHYLNQWYSTCGT